MDDHLQVLASVHRRCILRYLRGGRRDHATVEELLEHLRSQQLPAEGDRLPSRERLHVRLVQVDLPRLADHGVVEWDRRHDEVRYREVAVVEKVLDALTGDPVPVEN